MRIRDWSSDVCSSDLLIGRKLGMNTFIVVEKPSELRLVMEEAQALGVEPILGVRMRLASLGAGKWQNSGGDKAKFGLSPRQLLDLWKSLRDAGMGDALKLLHFRSEEHTSELQSLMRISYAVFCLKT